jgi:hypothetical protein
MSPSHVSFAPKSFIGAFVVLGILVSMVPSVSAQQFEINGDPQSSTIPVPNPELLTITQQLSGSMDRAVRNQKNITLLRFEASASRKDLVFAEVDFEYPKDVLLTELVFTAGIGSLNNGQNYALWVDTDANGSVDTLLQGNVTALNNRVTFAELPGGAYRIPQNHSVVFEVHADVSSSLASNSLQLVFSTADEEYVKATNLSGVSLNGINTNDKYCPREFCDIIVIPNSSVIYTLLNQGDLYATKDMMPVRPRQCLGGTLCDSVLRLSFHAENEDIDVTDLQLTSSGGLATSVDRLELYKDGSITPFATATIVGCGSDNVRNYYHTSSMTTAPAMTFCAKMQSQQLVVSKGADVKVLVRPRLKTDVDGALPNDSIQFFIDPTPVSNNATGSGAVRARGVASSNNLSANNQNSVAEGEVFIGTSFPASNVLVRGTKSLSVLSKITSITNANPDANGTQVPSGVADIGQFKIAAAPNSNSKNGLNKVALNSIMFNVTATNVAIDASSFRFYNKANSTVTKNCTALTTAGVPITGMATGSFLVDCSQLLDTSVNTVIDQGTDATFVLRSTVTNPQVSPSANSHLQVILLNFDSPSRTTYGPASSHFEWKDRDNAAATSATFLWVDYPETTVRSTSYQS